MKRQFAILLSIAVAAVGLSDSQARAGLLALSISSDGITDRLQDNSVATSLLGDRSLGGLGPANGIVDAGDVVIGIVKINTNNTTGFNIAAAGEFYVAFSATVGAAGSGSGTEFGNGISFALFATPSADPLSLTSLFPAIAASLGGAFPVGSVSAVITDLGGTADQTTSPVLLAFAALDAPPYGLEMVTGLAGGADFFEAELRDFNGSGAIEPVADFALLPTTTQIGQDKAALSVLFAPGLAIAAPVSILDLGFTLHSSDTTFSGRLFPAASGQLLNGWTFSDDSILEINAIVTPEPGTLAVFGMGLAVLGTVGCLRRKRKS